MATYRVQLQNWKVHQAHSAAVPRKWESAHSQCCVGSKQGRGSESALPGMLIMTHCQQHGSGMARQLVADSAHELMLGLIVEVAARVV